MTRTQTGLRRKAVLTRGWIFPCFVVTALLVLPASSASTVAGGSWPGRNGLIAFVAERTQFDVSGSRHGLAVIRADGRGFRMLTTKAGDNGPAWSPHGRRLAFSRRGDLYAIGVDGKGLRRLTRGGGHDSDPAWSPGARRIAFVRNEDSLYVVNANGSSARRIWADDGGVIEGVS